MMPEIRQIAIRCTICREDKPIADFYPSARGSKTGQCKGCVKKRIRAREEERAAAGLPRRYPKKKAKTSKPSSPPSVSAESLMKAISGGAADPRLEAALQIVAMQQRTVELLLERRRK